ncbi:cytochrome P450 [Streptomyces qinglanensis]|uniref:cytochrome P450 n=1 Tax=Streptomyces qinglanensis TaxID=943816 RepID=UPI003D732754
MTTSPRGQHPSDPAEPPPGCPAHASGGGRDDRFADAVRLYGPEVEADFDAVEARLRRTHGPVAPVRLSGDVGAWLILGYQENLQAMRNSTLFSRDPRNWNVELAPDSPLAPLTAWAPLPNLTDGPEHARLRGAVTHALETFDRQGVRRYAVRCAHQQIDSFAEVGKADLVSQYTEQLPLRVVARLLGLDEQHVPQLITSVRDMLTGSATAVHSNTLISGLLNDLFTQKRRVPAHDITSSLIRYKTDPARTDSVLTEDQLRDEVREHLRLLLTVAHAPTASLLASTLRMTLTDARFRGRLAGGQMSMPHAVEQTLWDQPPFPRLVGRWVKADTVLGRYDLRKGDLVVHAIGAANTDPAIRPEDGEPVHNNSSHLTFSAGEHVCPGQELGRAIVETGVDTLLERLPDYRLSVGQEAVLEHQALMSRVLESLPVEFTPVTRYFPHEQEVVRRPQPAPVAPQPAPAAPPAEPRQQPARRRSLLGRR